MNTMKVSEIKVGDLVYPPQREISLWMRKALVEKGLTEADMLLTVVEVRESSRKGWVFVKGRYSREWTRDYAEPTRDHFMSFLARPETAWKGAK